MARYVIYTRLSAEAIEARLRQIPAILAGKSEDRLGIARGVKLRIAVEWLKLVKKAYVIKQGGGTDDCGIKWPPLSEKYLAYGRGPFSTRRAGKRAPGVVVGGDRDGQPKDGFLSAAQMKLWRGIYAGTLAWLAQTHPIEEARGIAAAIAWKRLKEAGARTKLQVFGSRVVDILRDRGLLFDSLSPGVLSASGPDAAYSPPFAQIVKLEPGAMAVGTNVEYAAAHQYGKRADRSQAGRGAVKRQIWPEPEQIPATWSRKLMKVGVEGLEATVRLIAAGGAA